MQQLISNTDGARQLNELVSHVEITSKLMDGLRSRFDDEHASTLKEREIAIDKRELEFEKLRLQYETGIKNLKVEKESVSQFIM